MRKLFTLIFALMAVCSINAEEIEVWSGTFTSTGWGSAMQNLAWGNYDWSKVAAGTTLRLYATPDASGAQICVKHGQNWGDIPEVTSFPSVTSDKTFYDFVLTASGLADITSNNGVIISGHDFTLTKVCLVTALDYQAPVTLTMDEWGQVESKQFNGYSDDAKVTLTYDVTGATGYVNWGCGSIKSLDGTVEYGTYAIPVKKEGENKLSMTLGDIKKLLDAGPNTYNMYGIAFSVWGFGDGACTVTRKSLTIQEVVGYTGDGYKSPDTPADASQIGASDNSSSWWTAFSDYYTLKDGQKARITFKNYSSKVKNWFNWLVVFNAAGTQRGGEGYYEYAVYRADNYGWGDYYDKGALWCNYNWDTFTSDMDGADVVLDIYNENGVITGVSSTTTAKGDTYTYTFVSTDTKAKEIGFFLTVENAHLTNVNVKIASPAAVGYDDNTSAWWTAFSDYYTVPEGKKAHITFKNYSDKVKTYNNWIIVYTKAGTKRNDVSYKEYAVYRADNFGWGDYYDETLLNNNYNWSTFCDDMDGADVAIDVYNVAGVIYSSAIVTAANGNGYSYNFNTADTKAKDFSFFLTAEKAHLDDLNVEIADISKVTGDEVHAFYDWFLLCAQTLNNRDEFKSRDLGTEYQSAAYPIVLDYDGGAYKGSEQVAKDQLADAFLNLFKGTSLEALAKMYVAQANNVNTATGINNVATSASRTGKFIQNGRVVIVKNGNTYTTTGALLK